MRHAPLLALLVIVIAGCAPRPPSLPDRELTTVEQSLADFHALALANIRSRKLAIQTEALHLNQDQANLFWPLWRDYESRLATIEDALLESQRTYREQGRTMEGPVAAGLAKQVLEGRRNRDQLLSDAYDRIEKAVGPRLAVRWLQTEHQLLAISDLRAAAEAPLVPTISGTGATAR